MKVFKKEKNKTNLPCIIFSHELDQLNCHMKDADIIILKEKSHYKMVSHENKGDYRHPL